MPRAATLTIRELQPGDLDAAAATLGRAMRDNPLHLRAYGDDPEVRERLITTMFVRSLPRRLARGAVILGAFESDGLVAPLGVAGFIGPGRCQPTTAARLRGVPALVRSGGVLRAWRVLDWMREWSRRDPETPHWHLGPVGVDRHLQGRGIGTALLEAFTMRMDELGTAAYLETDRPENVPFYERFGFQVVTDGQVLGVPNWFMIRPG